MIGQRIRNWYGSPLLEPGQYARHSRGPWYACSPNGALANLEKHTVVEHEDGTITVSPSILVSGSNEQWHGFLERGVWRNA